MFELLMSADMMVPDPDGMTEKLVDKLGVYKHERWRQAFDNHPYICLLYTSRETVGQIETAVQPV